MPKTTLEQMGNFWGFFVPREILDELDFTPDGEFELVTDGGKLVIARKGDIGPEQEIELSDDDLDAFSACLEDL